MTEYNSSGSSQLPAIGGLRRNGEHGFLKPLIKFKIFGHLVDKIRSNRSCDRNAENCEIIKYINLTITDMGLDKFKLSIHFNKITNEYKMQRV